MVHLVPKVPAPEKRQVRRATVAKPADMLECPRCQGREVTPTLLGALLKGGKIQGGTKQFICTSCMLKGERVVVA